MNTNVILVDELDNPVGLMDKLEAHNKGLLHRAVSVFIFNSDGKMLLQKRAQAKYHSAGLWSNTACSHPFEGETTVNAASRRLNEEMGMDVNLTFAFSFMYKTNFSNGLTEHEFDHVFVGVSDVLPKPDMAEVETWMYATEKEIDNALSKDNGAFTEWFKLIYKRVFEKKSEL